MATDKQIAANNANAQFSTGARTSEGKAKSSKNSIIFGLFSGDFIRPGEEGAYSALEVAINSDLSPEGGLEEILTEEIVRAAWRLRRCGEVESHLVIRQNDGKQYILDPMEGSSATSEKIQKSVDRARSQAHRLLHKCTAELRKRQNERKNSAGGGEVAADSPASSIQSIKEPITQRTQSARPQTPRNAACPCGSGQKYKRCCGKGAPAVLHAA